VPGLVRALYSLVLRLATPLYLARLWWRGRAEPQYRVGLAQRLGYGSTRTPGRLWLHAVSLGETLAAAPLIDALRQQNPKVKILLTHSTATGFAAGTKLLRSGDGQTWLPYDTPSAVRRFLRQHQPAAGVMMETEIWPNVMHGAEQAGVPMVLANARLSAKSSAKGQRYGVLMRPAAASFSAVLAQTEADAERLRSAGAPNVQVVGNLKFDITPKAELLAQGKAWRQLLGRPVLLSAVSREGEEEPLLQAFAALAAPRPLLLIVPRHPQRFNDVAELISQAQLQAVRRSSWGSTPPPEALLADVWLGDSMGEMPLYYGCADVALLGGSFEPLGGQNLIEAAACGCPLVMGPHTFNFAQAAEQAVVAGAAERVTDMPAAVVVALALLASSDRLGTMAQHGQAFAAAHRGAALRTAQAVLKLLPGDKASVDAAEAAAELATPAAPAAPLTPQ
jgi:3-deoxy-D-manno-octulosonic-acid transferase